MREFFLQKWGPEVGCCRNGSHLKDVWVKVVGLPLHLWSREVFKSIGERCGGFIVVDEDTAFFSELQWARILVKAPGKIRQARSPWFNEERREVRDEGRGDSRVSGSVRGFQNGKSGLQAQASGVQVECGRGQGEAAGAEVAEGRRPFTGDLGPSNSRLGPRKDKGQAYKGKRDLGLSEERFWAKSPLPVSFKKEGWGWASKPTSGMEFVEWSPRLGLPQFPRRLKRGWIQSSWRSKMKMPSVDVAWMERHRRALMEEASRYDVGPSPLSQLGHRGHSYPSSSSFGGIAEAVGTSEGVIFGVEGSWIVMR
ncbi:hypothetical protein CK203_014320 [Vitis vinifera]|uniref:Uncharacterized protein n=1 Tax=Vitis vinifera TaxID=29760 RepID=A0A438K516_VITVI|nr:hypothetical protein CK203_014320 [Vitis vinifera]